MKTFRTIVMAVMLSVCGSAGAQFYQIANQVPNLISPALSGSFNYRGFVDMSYTKGVGTRNADYLELSTTQGFQYRSWFFMGVGLGVQAVMTNPHDASNLPTLNPDDYDPGRSHSKTGCVIPLYTDFRFDIGSPTNTSFYIDLRLGASFLVSDNYLEIGDGFLTNTECFYFKPSAGLRIPLDDNGRKAVNVGVSYQLVTSNYWYRYASNVSLSSVGLTVGFQW